MGVVEGNRPASDNDWETIKRGGDPAIENWIAGQLAGKSVVVVLIGSQTAGRKWVNHEIRTAWKAGKAVLGIHVHHLRDSAGKQSAKGSNPFDEFKVGATALSSIVKSYDPPYVTSEMVYSHIKDNMAGWIEEAIAIRAKYV